MKWQQPLDKAQITLFYLLLFSSQTPVAALAASTSTSTAVMGEVLVTADKDAQAYEGKKVLPEIQGTRIYSGKKTAIIDLQKAPAVVNNNFRQVFEQTPSLLLSEESTPLFSVGYRGLEPHRAQFTQLLKDGVPIHADMFGYPEAYYVPPTQVIDHMDFVHGGASLMYGPQPGGALNFVTKDPYTEPFRFESENSIGSHDLFSTYESVSGTQGKIGYYGYFHHRQAQGFRDFNSQYDLEYGGLKLTIEQDPTMKWTLGWDSYHETHGEPGGLTRTQFDTDIAFTAKLADRFELNRHAGQVGFEKEFSEVTRLDVKGYGVYYERLSWRQRGGGFGTVPTGATASTNDIEDQEFFTGGVDSRLSHDYSAFGSDEHVISGGVLYHHTTSPRLDYRGVTADAEEGTLRKDADRTVDYLSFFAENRFKFGRLSVTPGVRLENIWQSIKENLNLDKTTVSLADDEEFDFEVLGGVGAQVDVTDTVDVYANFSEGYRPKVFTQAVPNGTNQVVNEDLQAGRSWQADAGVRGYFYEPLTWDISVFHMAFEDQIGSATIGGLSTVQNVGDAEHQGVEITTEFDLNDNWSVFYNAMLLDAEFTGGPNTGKNPQYAPDFIQRAGAQFNWQDRFKMRLAGTFVDDHFADDNNTTQRIVPSYKVWDLTGEMKVWQEDVSIFGGINNLFNESYFARVRADGIDPADGRNYYGGVKVKWG